MIEYWPEGVPVHVSQDYSEEPAMPRISFEPEEGDTIDRPAGTADIEIVKCSIPMKRGEFELFKVWVRRTLKRGTSRFYRPHPLTQLNIIAKFSDHPTPYTASYRNPRELDVSFSLKVWEID